MQDLIQVGANTYYIDLNSKVGVYVPQPSEAILIDSSNQEAAKKIEAILDENHLNLRCILNTHCHADHIGSNFALQERYKCPIYAQEVESYFINVPLMSACFLYGGHPSKIMRHHLLAAKGSKCRPFEAAKLPEGFKFHLLSGHAMGMTAISTPDDIVFTGDIACGREVLEKYPISFYYDVGLYLQSLDLARAIKGKLFICAHADPVEDLNPLLDHNRKIIEDIFTVIKEFCTDQPKSFEHIQREVFLRYNYGSKPNYMIFANAGSAIRGHISYLVDTRQLKTVIEDGFIKYITLSDKG